ncbi:MAG: amidase family protein [Acidimicrobiales bacterium]|jgi:amidase
MTDPHSVSSEIAYLSTADIHDRLNDGRLTSSQLVDALLSRIEAIDAPGTAIGLNAVAALSNDAREVARERDDERARGVIRGPLHGVPVVIKDNIEAVGLPGLAGSTALIGRPTRDAPLVTRLRDAGAIIMASTNLSQWANIRSMRSTSGYSSSAGLVGNPWALDRSAGGSSSGTGAAVAAGLSPLGVGTETDGSIVCPASVNGIAGLKPTVGNVPKQYVIPVSESQDSPGPMGRTVGDVALLYGVLSATSSNAEDANPSIAAATNWRTGNPETDQLYDDVVVALRESGFEVTSRELALPDEQVFQDELTVMLAELVDGISTYLSDRPGDGVKSLADVIAYEDEHRDTELIYFGHDLFTKAIDIGGTDTPAYVEARPRNLAWAVDTCLNPGLEGVDVIIAPAYGPSWKSDLAVGGHPGPASCATMAPAIAGWPIMSIPMGLVKDLPVGLAIIGRPDSEWTVLEAARRIETVIATRSALPRPFWKLPTRG